MGEAAGRLLLLPDNVVFSCQNSGACCRSDWLIGVDAASHARLRDVDWRTVDPALGDALPELAECRLDALATPFGVHVTGVRACVAPPTARADTGPRRMRGL